MSLSSRKQYGVDSFIPPSILIPDLHIVQMQDVHHAVHEGCQEYRCCGEEGDAAVKGVKGGKYFCAICCHRIDGTHARQDHARIVKSANEGQSAEVAIPRGANEEGNRNDQGRIQKIPQLP